jgi:phosphotransferase system enzyme I (PtsP)
MKNPDYSSFISGIKKLFRENSSLQVIFNDIVRSVSDFIECDNVSFYIYDDRTLSLIHTATYEKTACSDPRGRIKIREDIARLSIKESGVIYENNAVPGGGIEESVLALPVVKGLEKIGVLVLTREGNRYFYESEVGVSKMIADNLAEMFDARFMLYSISHSKDSLPLIKEEEKFIRGKVIFGGYGYSGIYIFKRVRQFESFKKMKFDKNYTKDEFLIAVERTAHDLTELEKRIKSDFSEAGSQIFNSYLMILKDISFTGEMIKLLDKGENAPSAVIKVASGFISKLQSSGNEYISEKANDIEDIAIRILRNLVGENDAIPEIAGKIVIARELLLSDLIRLYSEKIGGLILLEGGVTSHLSILVRTLKIPAVIADNAKLLELPVNARILLDADTGIIFLNPGEDITERYTERSKLRTGSGLDFSNLKNVTETLDGVRIRLMINVNLLSDLKTVIRLPYDGIGLYRTEFPFLIRQSFPDEETQFGIYKKLVDSAEGREVIFRTLDIGGDKILPYYNLQKEKNPFLGMRSIRFSLRNEDLFKQQLRAILRAGAGADIKIMFPMISSIEEFNSARTILDDCLGSLKSDNIPYNANVKIGMMVEVPSVVEIINDLAKVSDFFSIGTNDLVQYMLAVDRSNEKTADNYITHHPAVLKAIYRVINACSRHGREISICGDMANNKKYIAFLLGSGIRCLSVDPSYFPVIQAQISKTDTAKAQDVARRILQQSTVRKIEEMMTE